MASTSKGQFPFNLHREVANKQGKAVCHSCQTEWPCKRWQQAQILRHKGDRESNLRTRFEFFEQASELLMGIGE
jgi:hypothetical protein